MASDLGADADGISGWSFDQYRFDGVAVLELQEPFDRFVFGDEALQFGERGAGEVSCQVVSEGCREVLHFLEVEREVFEEPFVDLLFSEWLLSVFNEPGVELCGGNVFDVHGLDLKVGDICCS